MPSADFRKKLSPEFLVFLDQTSDGVMLIDPQSGSIVESNQQAQKALGLSRKELLNRPFSALASPSESVDLKARIRDNPSARPLECILSGRGDRPLPVELRLSQLEVSGDPVLLVIIVDQSERLKIQQDMDLLNIAIANVTTGVTVADARLPDMPLIYVNRGFEALTGYAACEVVGRSCRFLQGNEREQPELDVLRQALSDGGACIVRLRNFKKDGTLFYNELHLSPVRNSRGDLTHFVGIQLDVTEEVRARESLEKSERQSQIALEREAELNAIKSRFISMVSHEFRTPMTGMHASASLIRKFGDKLGKEKAARHLLNIETSLKRMNRMLDDILFFSRAEADRIQVERKPVEVNEYFAELIEQLSPIFPGREIRFTSNLDIGTAFPLDVDLLNHIFLNLIGNALKYSPPDAPVHCSAKASQGRLKISIVDSGIGIPDSDRKRLFEAFHRAGNVGTRQGTGLGLNIAMRAIELLDGSLNFSSRENRGSTFEVTLPISPSK